MELKKGVSTTNVQPELLIGLMVADSVYLLYQTPCVVTSLNDSKHSFNSLHYAGCAADILINNLPMGKAEEVAECIRVGLGHNPDYDVVLEADHIHLEWQPKYRD